MIIDLGSNDNRGGQFNSNLILEQAERSACPALGGVPSSHSEAPSAELPQISCLHAYKPDHGRALETQGGSSTALIQFQTWSRQAGLPAQHWGCDIESLEFSLSSVVYINQTIAVL